MPWSYGRRLVNKGQRTLRQAGEMRPEVNERFLVLISCVLLADFTPPGTNANPFIRMKLEDSGYVST